MSAHQVITGALNKGESVFAVGTVEGINFTACAVGTDVVILASNFERVQVIPGGLRADETVVTSVNCCGDSGKIAATYGRSIRIFDPVHHNGNKFRHKLNYRWFESCNIRFEDKPVSSVQWSLEGMRLLVSSGNELLLYQNKALNRMNRINHGVVFSISEEKGHNDTWECVWRTELSEEARFIRYSPDSTLFATCGENGVLVKVWYQDNDIDAHDGQGHQVNFKHCYLQHPCPITGFEWRKTGRYMPRHCIQNVLVTWCVDNTSRIWKENTVFDNAFDINGDLIAVADVNDENHKKHKHFRVKNARKKILNRLSKLKHDNKRKKVSECNSGSGAFCASGSRSPSCWDLVSSAGDEFTTVEFYLACTINADNDCLLVPSMDSNNSLQKKPLTVHWLNNKELIFSKGAEKLLAEALLNETPTENHGSEGSISECNCLEMEVPPSVKPSMNGTSEATTPVMADKVSITTSDALDIKLESLLRQWTKSSDILFAIHPVDGSLLSWTCEWLDDSYRQPTVSFTSRFPFAFPLTDASSLNPLLNTFNPHDPIYVDVLQRHHDQDMPNSSDTTDEAEVERADHTSNHNVILRKIQNNSLLMLTSHENGSLNLWRLSMEENSNFTTILNVTHMSRMCGHRFQVNKVVPHPVLPLLITSSQFSSELCVSVNNNPDVVKESELILWKISPVGPLCHSGGVRELARITSSAAESFSCLAWIPAILPSSTLGSVCNSPSSCFVASDGDKLIVYQAVVDARGLLSELFSVKTTRTRSSSFSSVDDPVPSNHFHRLNDTFNVVSTQSTARPGCVLRLSDIANSDHSWDGVMLLHIFNERLTISNCDVDLDANAVRGSVIDRSKATTFSDRYFLVMVEKSTDADRLRMWSVNLSSQVPILIDNDDAEGQNNIGYYRSASPMRPSAAKLAMDSTLLCDCSLGLPPGVRVLSAVATAGHLPSSSLYPACQAPYIIMVACSDENIRFYKCVRKEEGEKSSYSWEQWRMISDDIPSALEMDGSICNVSAAHSGRFACAFKAPGSESFDKIEIAVFECESSGGVEWLREDTLKIDDTSMGRSKFGKCGNVGEYYDVKHPVDNFVCGLSQREPSHRPTSLLRRIPSRSKFGKSHPYVWLDWVSTEDGSHILTVGVGTHIYIYTQVSQDTAQRNMVMMKETHDVRRPPLRKASSLIRPEDLKTRLVRWQCVRELELDSADGLPPFPTTMSWVRDGLLLVGVHSEMRVYNQWSLSTRAQAVTPGSEKEKLRPASSSIAPSLSLNLSKSHSMLDQLSKRPKFDHSSGTKMIKEIMNRVMSTKDLQEMVFDDVVEAVSDEGLFEAARLASPILPQYHPKQLIEMLNAGKTRRVKAILLHVLRILKRMGTGSSNALTRGASLRKLSTVDYGSSPGGPKDQVQRSMSIMIEDGNPNYDELDGISPLPLYLLFEADEVASSGLGDESARMNSQENYDSLFSAEVIEDLPEDLLDDEEGGDGSVGGRSRANSCSSNTVRTNYTISTVFTARDNRLITELLTHTHLPGLTSVDQMHLLAIADTLSHFSSDVMDKLTQANAAMKAPSVSILGDNSGSAAGYAQSGTSTDSVDECGLRFLMAMKQHEYLLLCLPPKSRQSLRARGIHSAHIIWALHSEAENELLNTIPCIQKSQPTWPELRSLGVVWWLKNMQTLKTCVEKLAKAGFQQDQNPMDACLYYLALRKKNVLTHLFKSVRDAKMSEFFQQDFSQEFWKKAALKNAFVLLSKRRYEHAAGFFLLGGSLKDAVQVIMTKLDDIQLAMLVIRLYEQDITLQNALLKELLCRDVLGLTVEEFDFGAPVSGSAESMTRMSGRQRNPFERSMAFWLLKDYARAASTLLEEASKDRFESSDLNDCSLSDIFSFYTFLRRHPLVVRQKLKDAGVQMGSTDAFLALGKELENQVTPSERRLFFRTASAHLAKGCPLLALDVLQRLPKNLNIATKLTFKSLGKRDTALKSVDEVEKPAFDEGNTVDALDWSAPTNVVANDDLELKWSDEEDEVDEEEAIPEVTVTENGVDDSALQAESAEELNDSSEVEPKRGNIDIIAQQLKFAACLRILMDEMSMLASGFEVDGGQLRSELFQWLEREVVLLKKVCDYHIESSVDSDKDDSGVTLDFSESHDANQLLPLHEALQRDRMNLSAKARATLRRRRWLIANQKLIRSFTSYCALHSAQNYRLTSALMELLLLLLEVQQDSGFEAEKLSNDPIPDIQSFPLLVASLSSHKMFVPSPLHFIENQCGDLMYSIMDIVEPPVIEQSLVRAYSLYHICQGLSSCVYQSLSDIDHCCTSDNCQHNGALIARRMRTASATHAATDDLHVSSVPSKWPGVDNLVALLSREHDEDSPNLRLLLAECFVAISMSLFCYAFTACDSRWLYRMAAHEMNISSFGDIFGGGGEKKLKTAAPARPPRPARPMSTLSSASQNTVVSKNDSAALRARLHAKVFGTDLNAHSQTASYLASPNSSPSMSASNAGEQTVSCWIPPNRHIVQYFAQKPQHGKDLGVEYDSDDSLSEDEDDSEDADLDFEPPAHNTPNSYPWLLMRLACVHMQLYRMSHFLSLAGFDAGDLPSLSPRITSVVRLLENWVVCLEGQLDSYPGGCPANLLPDMSVDNSDPLNIGLLKKYRVLIEPRNTPFECDDSSALPVRRLWSYLVRQEHLSEIFVRFIFGQGARTAQDQTGRTPNANSYDGSRLPDPYKIVHREQEPIVAFACSNNRNGWVVLSTGRELQELDISSLHDENENQGRVKSSWLHSRAELDIALERMSKDPIKDNDDYQLITDTGRSPVPGHSFMVKRSVTGVRRLDSHPTLPYYLSGSSDGSIKLWEWGSQQPLFTARVAGQYAKVTKVVFSTNGNKFAAVDGDGLLCLWQASQSVAVRKPFFNQKCHQKTAADVKFLGQTSSVLVTAGHGTADVNLALWDTLLPQSKAMVHSWVTHPDGATSVHYLPHSQTIISGGRHGEINVWDVRQRQQRTSIKAFEGTSVKCLAADPAGDLIIAGSNEGDIKIWSSDVVPSLLYSLPTEHATRGGFSLRQVGSSNLQGVQQLLVDSQMRMFSCGADCSVKFRTLPNVFHNHWM